MMESDTTDQTDVLTYRRTDAPTYRRTDVLTHRHTDVLTHRRTFVGLGFGPIQAGLFLYEAARSGNFGRLVVSEIVPETVEAVWAAGGYALNIAQNDGVETVEVAPVDILNPTVESEREQLIAALTEASEAATALPSVALYDGDDASSPARLIASALERRGMQGAPLLIHTGENAVNAAEALEDAVRRHLPDDHAEALLARVSIVDTVIGKMSGYAPVRSANDNEGATPLAPVAPGLERAFLVEAFNSILISRPVLANGAQIERGITIFHEEDDLLPFEEFKLYCHNGMHAIAAYLGKIAGCTSMAQLVHVPGLLPLVRDAVIEEAGAALVARYGASNDDFTPASVAEKVDDLIERMVNPFLDDALARVARDPARKLGWEDRLVGAMNLCLDLGITSHRYALGAAAALADVVEPAGGQTGAFPWGRLPELWRRGKDDAGRVAYLEQLIAEAWQHLEAFRDASSATPMAPAGGAQVAQLGEERAVNKVAASDSAANRGAVTQEHPNGVARPAPDRSKHEALSYYGDTSA